MVSGLQGRVLSGPEPPCCPYSLLSSRVPWMPRAVALTGNRSPSQEQAGSTTSEQTS